MRYIDYICNHSHFRRKNNLPKCEKQCKHYFPHSLRNDCMDKCDLFKDAKCLLINRNFLTKDEAWRNNLKHTK